MTKLFKHEPKLGDRFRLNSGEIVKFAVLLPETLGATHRLIAVKKNGRVLPYHYPSGKYYEEDTSVPLDIVRHYVKRKDSPNDQTA